MWNKVTIIQVTLISLLTVTSILDFVNENTKKRKYSDNFYDSSSDEEDVNNEVSEK